MRNMEWGLIVTGILTLVGALLTARAAGKQVQTQENTKHEANEQTFYSEYVDDIREDLQTLKAEAKEMQGELRATHNELMAERQSRMLCEQHREQQDYEMGQMKIQLENLEDRVARYFEAFGPDPRGFEVTPWSQVDPNQPTLWEET